MKRIVWMFSGQGSQYFNMGRDLYDADPVFRESMDRCDAVVRRARRESLLHVMFNPGAKSRFTDFTELGHTHPALFSIQYSLAQALSRRGLKPDLLLGYSLGEMVAAAVGGALPLETALESILNQARLLAAVAPPGAMLAVLESPGIWDAGLPLYAGTWVAARNTPQHFVLAGQPAAIERLQQHFQTRDILNLRLPVSVAFHSPLIDALERPFRELTQSLALAELTCPLVSTAYMAQMTRLPAGFYWEVTRRPVAFQDTVAWLEARGAAVYLDLGPSGTLAGFLKHGLDRNSSSRAIPIMTPFNRPGDTLRRLEAALNEARRETGH